MCQAVPLTKPYITPDMKKAIGDVLDSGWLTQGKRVAEFEDIVREYVNCRYAVAVSSCTAGLEIVMDAIRPENREFAVMVPAYTFPATANAVGRGTVYLADIDLDTFTIDPCYVNGNFGAEAVITVDLFGLMAGYNYINRRTNSTIIADSACGLGATIDGKFSTDYCQAAVVSFHPRKIITTGEGGMILTNDAFLARFARQMRDHGRGDDGFPLRGHNMRMSDVHAAMGIVQMRHLEFILRRRQEIASRYTNAFDQMPTIIPPHCPAAYYHTYQSYVIRSTHTRAYGIISWLRNQGIEAQIGTYHLTDRETGRSMGREIDNCRNCETARVTAVSLPIYTDMTDAEQSRVIEAVQTFEEGRGDDS